MEVQAMKTEDMHGMPSKFWNMPQQEFNEIIERGGWLNAEQCARLWRMTDRQGQPPERLMVVVSKKHLDRLIAKPRR
jgi:hypothetical protein